MKLRGHVQWLCTQLSKFSKFSFVISKSRYIFSYKKVKKVKICSMPIIVRSFILSGNNLLVFMFPFKYSWYYIIKGTCSVHSFNGDYLSLEHTDSWGTFFMKSPVSKSYHQGHHLRWTSASNIYIDSSPIRIPIW